MHLHSRVDSPLLAHYNMLVYPIKEFIIHKLPVVSKVHEYVRKGGGMELGSGGKGAVVRYGRGGARPGGFGSKLLPL